MLLMRGGAGSLNVHKEYLGRPGTWDTGYDSMTALYMAGGCGGGGIMVVAGCVM